MNTLLLIDDEADVQYSFRRIFQSPDTRIETADSGEMGLELIPRLKPDLVIMDVRMGGMSGLETLRRLRQTNAKLPVIMMTAYGTTQTAIEAMKLGAYDYLLKPFDIPKLKEVVFAALKSAQDMKQVVRVDPALDPEDCDLGIIGRSEPMQQVFKLVGQLAASDATALITGESGTGKELVARAIYQNSRRSQQPFVAINCAAIPENLLESEMFGHEKGSFTGATSQRIGRFEQCNNGTLFLDEIGDMALATQTKILRVLQDGCFERVGGSQSVRVNVRIIAATNRPLELAVTSRQFREDLFYRLNVVRIQMPALRERPADISLLAAYFLRKTAKATGLRPKSLSSDALEALQHHGWPGNVRQLENVICRACVVSKSDVILLTDLPDDVLKRTSEPKAPGPEATETTDASRPAIEAGTDILARATVADLCRAMFQWARTQQGTELLPVVERELIVHALLETRGNQVQAARMLGITRATLRKRIERFQIRKEFSAS